MQEQDTNQESHYLSIKQKNKNPRRGFLFWSSSLICYYVVGEQRKTTHIETLRGRCMRTRSFHLADVLSVINGRIISTTPIERTFSLLNFMTDDSLFRHQLPRIIDECKPHLDRQFPQLIKKDMVSEIIDFLHSMEIEKEKSLQGIFWKEWMEKQIGKYGETFLVEQIPPEAHIRKDPFTEMVEIVTNKEKSLLRFSQHELENILHPSSW